MTFPISSRCLCIACAFILIKSVHPMSAPYRSGRSRDWLKMKNPACAAVKREAEERWPRLSEQIFRVDKWSLCRG